MFKTTTEISKTFEIYAKVTYIIHPCNLRTISIQRYARRVRNATNVKDATQENYMQTPLPCVLPVASLASSASVAFVACVALDGNHA